jgi:chorismate lyase / 3-hydroxybenzoate synthase
MLKSQEPEARAHDTSSRAAQPEPPTRRAVAAGWEPAWEPPAWVAALLADAPSTTTANPSDPGAELRVSASGRFMRVTATIDDADALSTEALDARVAGAYRGIGALLAQHDRHAIRFWNFIPQIHAQVGDSRDRYMVFNAGRFHAFSDLYGSKALFARALPTASAVGIDRGPLVIHALGDVAAGTPVENPRQIPAYSYSRRYGPLPPCFARATLTEREAGEHYLLVGGTASIVGEDSQHARDPRRQALETFDNLAQLVASAAAQVHAGSMATTRADGIEALTSPPVADPLDALTDLRVYFVRDEDAALVRDLVLVRFSRATRIELTRADLCRSELLVEIEGLARL